MFMNRQRWDDIQRLFRDPETRRRLRGDPVQAFRLLRLICSAPVIIGGCGRSGTSLLLSILSSCPSLFTIPHETTALCPTGYGRRIREYRPLKVHHIYQLLAGQKISRGQRRWCEKTPKNVLFFGRILYYFGRGARIIHIIRDGRDVVTSRHPQAPDRFWVPKERWIDDVTAGLVYEGHPQVLTIRYEDLVLRQDATLGRIISFIGEERYARYILDWYEHARIRQTPSISHPALEKIHERSVGRWRDPRYHAVVQEIMGDPRAVALLNRLGYLDG